MIAEVLEAAARKGVRFWAEQGELRYQAPKGALTTHDLQALRTLKPQIIAYLETAATTPEADAPLLPRRHHGELPLTFPQVVHWRLYQLSHRPAVRHLAVALKLQGALDVTLLEHCIGLLLQRHEVLRTRIVLRGQQPFQTIGPQVSFELSRVDLSPEPEALRGEKVTASVARFVMQPISIVEQALFDACLFTLDEAEYVLVLATEHLVSDAQSMSILVRDLFEMYSRGVRGQEMSLAALPFQFADYAAWQMEQLSSWRARHGGYWREHLRGASRVRFPRSESANAQARSGWGRVDAHIDAESRSRLEQWCRRQHTTLVMAVFTAYVAAVMQWCKVDDAVFRFQTAGRWDRRLQDMVGYLATVLHLRMRLRAGEDIVELLRRAMTELASASEHADLSFVDAQLPRADFASNPAFNWVPAAPVRRETEASLKVTELPIRREAFSRFDDDHEPVLLCFDRGDVIEAAFHYPRRDLEATSMQAFAEAFRRQLARLSAH